MCFFGDGAANQGVLLEALNLSSIWRLPVVYVCENNGYTEWMRTSDITAGHIADRARPFRVPGTVVDGNDVLAVRAAVTAAAELARGGGGPSLIEARTYRILAHNEGEEAFSGTYRPQAEIEEWQRRDPIGRLAAVLSARPEVTEGLLADIRQAQRRLVDDAVEFAVRSPEPAPAEALDDLYATGGHR